MITRICEGLASRWRAFVLRRRGAGITGNVWLRSIRVPRNAGRVAMGDGAGLDEGVVLLVSGSADGGPAITIGSRVYINRHTFIDATDQITIGDDCMIGPFCYITDHDHQMGPDGRPASGTHRSLPVTIMPRAWIGAHVTILKGVTIGASAIVGAGSVVTKSVPDGAVVAGNPARPIERRAPS